MENNYFFTIMFKPRSDQQGNAFFTSGQILTHGNPEDNGWDDAYYVIEEEEEAHPRVATYLTCRDYTMVEKKIHRYCRISRFRGILYHLMGMGTFSTRKSKERLSDISTELPTNISYTPPCLMWDTLWTLLKKNKIPKCYSAIPTIIKSLKLGIVKKNDKAPNIFKRVMDDFIEMHNIFESIKKDMGRMYFPNLRSMALKLLKRHGFETLISIPLARTPCKVDRVEFDYGVFWDKLREKEIENVDDFFGF